MFMELNQIPMAGQHMHACRHKRLVKLADIDDHELKTRLLLDVSCNCIYLDT